MALCLELIATAVVAEELHWITVCVAFESVRIEHVVEAVSSARQSTRNRAADLLVITPQSSNVARILRKIARIGN